MDIFDSQVHFNRVGSLEAGVAAMDALGIATLLHDEFTVVDEAGHVQPGEMGAGGVFRPKCAGALAAAAAHPERIGVLRRVDHRDRELDAIVAELAGATKLAALRTLLSGPEDVEAFAAGGYDRLFEVADRHGLPVTIMTQGHNAPLARYARDFPNVRFVIDHCGVPLQLSPKATFPDSLLTLGGFSNVSLKWSHAPLVFSQQAYPFADTIPLLKRLLDGFGRERVMWASDSTESAPFYSWAEALFYLRDCPDLSDLDKEWLLGRTARSVFDRTSRPA